MKTPQNICDSLREAIEAYPNSMLQLAKDTGVQRASIGRFLRGERSLRLDRAAVLAEFFGLELRKQGGK